MTEQELIEARKTYAAYGLDLDKLRNTEVKMTAQEMTNSVTLKFIRRLAGLDPDGPRVPMQPHETYDQCFLRMQVETDQHTRDAYLCRAVRFT